MRLLLIALVFLSFSAQAASKEECVKLNKLLNLSGQLTGYAFGRSMTQAGLSKEQKQKVIEQFKLSGNGVHFMKEHPAIKDFERLYKELGCN